ncbi:MAG TPA: alpha/beta fold hydrolase [Anaeromyxobacteraceae bacterium]|nr:alpha/beta fold hydrolase [Anaeromyxobacteraceae bacterium]
MHVRPFLAPWPLRIALAAATAIAPSLAALAGERLFLTPPRRRASRDEREALAAGETFAVQAGRERLRAWRFGAGPTVLLVHGWGGGGGQLAAFVPSLVAAGCAVVTFDAPAHGASTGRLASGLSFAEAVSAVAAHVEARAAIGHSMGAAGLGWALAGGLHLDAAVMLAPPRGAAPFFHRFCDALVLQEHVRDALRGRIRRRYGIAPEDFDLLRRVANASLPLLVIHDGDDREVPWEDGEAIARAWPGAVLVRTERLGHRRILRSASVTAQAVAFVQRHLPRCACGRVACRAVGSEAWCDACALERELYDPSRRPSASPEPIRTGEGGRSRPASLTPRTGSAPAGP